MKLLIFILVLPGWSFGQTVVIAKKTKDAIYVGTDSKASEFRDNVITGKPDVSFLLFCKIIKLGNYYISPVHEFPYENIAYAKAAASKRKDFKGFVDLYSNTFGQYMADTLTKLKYADSKKYELNYPKDSAVAFGFCFGFSGELPRLIRVSFVNAGLINGGIGIKTKYGEDTAMGAGEIGEIAGEIIGLNKYTGDPSKSIYNLIKKQCKNQASRVGEPINVIKVTKTGFKWEYNGCK